MRGELLVAQDNERNPHSSKDNVAKDVKCPICEATMDYFRKQNYWKCPVCGTEVWPDDVLLKEVARKERELSSAEQLREQIRWAVGGRVSDPLPSGPADKKKSSSKSGRRRKKKPKIDKEWLYRT